MYLDRAVLIPKVKGISFRTKGENTYVQYEIGRVYNPEKKYNNPRRVDIGVRIPEQEEMMLPNENYLQYFSDEMEKAEGVREDLLGDYEEERQRRYALRELFLPIFYEFQAMGRRAPEEVVNEAKVERLNKILGPMMEMLQDEEYAEYLEMIPMPEKEEGKDGKVVWTGMSYSDVAMILNHFKSLGNRYFRKRF